MRYCPKCGSQEHDETRFCSRCGLALSAPQNQYNAQEYPVQQAYNANYSQSTPSAVSTLKLLGSSPIFLVSIIAFAASAIFSLIASIVNSTTILSYIFAISKIFGVSSELQLAMLMYSSELTEAMEIISNASITSSVLSVIPTVLMFIGLLLIYLAARKPNSMRMSTSGFTLIQVMTILSLIGTCILIFIVEIVLVICLLAVQEIPTAATTATPFVIAMILTLIIAALIIVYKIKIISSLGAAKSVIFTGKANHKASGYVGVICFISALFSAIGLIVQFVQLSYIGTASIILSILSTLTSVTAVVMFGILIFKYRSAMRHIQ